MGEECCEHDRPDMSEMMMSMTNDAWAELMVDKMKKVFEELKGQTMDKAARVCAEYSIAVWAERMKTKDMTKEPSPEEAEAFKKKLEEAFRG